MKDIVPKQKIFQEYRELCYPNGKKIVSNKFIKRIGKLAICIWYFDDGCYNAMTNGIQIYSMCFSYKENLKLQRMLKDKFGLNFNIQYARGKTHRLYFLACTNGKDTNKFLVFIKKNTPYIPKSLNYKMGKLHKGNLNWIEEKMKAKRDRQKVYFQENKKRIKKVHHKYYQKNEKKMKKQMQDYYQKNRNKLRKIQKEYYWKNREKVREIQARYRNNIKRKRRGV